MQTEQNIKKLQELISLCERMQECQDSIRGYNEKRSMPFNENERMFYKSGELEQLIQDEIKNHNRLLTEYHNCLWVLYRDATLELKSI